MGTRQRPVVGNWYRRADRPQAFRIVAIDSAAGTIDVEYYDGTVDEWPVTHWLSLDIEAADAPGDWTGPFDDLEQDDIEADGAQQESARALLEGDLREVPPHLSAHAARRTRTARPGHRAGARTKPPRRGPRA